MKTKSTSQSAFLNLRVLIGLFVMLAGVFLALVSFGPATTGFAQGTTRAEMTLAMAQALGINAPACVAGAEMFNDVPASSPFCPFIEELSRRGITGGCAPSLFCPGAPVTRQQMAVFLVKSMTTVSAQNDPPGSPIITNTAPNTINTANITAETAGTLVISGKTFVNNNNAAGGTCTLNVLIDGVLVTPGLGASFFDIHAEGGVAGEGDQVTHAYTIARSVSAGSHTVEQQVSCTVQPYQLNSNELVLQFSPGGSVVAAASAQSSGASDGSDR
jgi:S-layer homology domain